MRPLAVGEVAQWPAPKLKVEIENGSGTYIDYSSFIPQQGAGSIGESINDQFATGSLALRRRNNAGASLSPLMGGSALNVDDLGAFSPAIDRGRGIRFSAAKNGTATYRELLAGRINRVDWSQDPIVLDVADQGAWLADTQIKVEGTEYGTMPVGTALEVVIQNIVDATPSGKGTPGLYTPVSPSFLITTWAQGRVKVLEAIRDIALQSTGWDVRFRYDASHVSRLTLLDPQRDRTSVDATITSYRAIRALALDIANIRNSGLTLYTDVDGDSHTITATDDTSIADFGERYFELPSSEAIDTEAEATALLGTVIHDLAGAPAELTLELDFFWPVQLYDRFTIPANGRHFDEDQEFAVSGYQHSFDGGHAITTMTLAERVIGAYDDWHTRILPVLPDGTRCILSNIQRTDTDTDSTISWTPGPDVAEVWAAYVVKDAPEQASDWPSVAALVFPLADGVRSLTVPRPTDQQITMVQLEPHRADLSVGIVKRLVITATPQVPTWEPDDLETATTGTQWLSFTERGIAIVAVDMQTQVGTNPISGVGPPTRGPGETSVVKGGTLGDFEYEFDVPLDPTRQSWIVVGYTLSNGTRIGIPPFAFDRDKLPAIVTLTVDGSRLRVSGDSDAKAIGVYSVARAWGYEVDGQFLDVDLTVEGNGPWDGQAGMTSGMTDTFLVRAFSEPIVLLPENRFQFDMAERRITVYNAIGDTGGAGAPEATLSSLTAYAPAADGSVTAQIAIKATSAPTDWTVQLFISEDGSTPDTDETANVSPALSAPPTSLTAYSWTSSWPSVPHDPTTRLVTMRARVDLLDDVGTVRDTRETSTSWYTGNAV
jgi:hypothetical protein